MWPSRGEHEATPLDRAAWLSVRVLAVGIGVVAVLLVASRLRVVLLPIAVALLLSAPLRPLAARLGRVLPPSLAAVVSVLGLVAVVVGALTLAGRAVAQDADELSRAVTEGIDEVEEWLVDGPIGVEQERIDDLRSQLGDRAPDALRGAASGAVVVAEVFAGLLLALILAIFAIRDGDRLVEALARRSPPRRAARIRLGAAATWKALRRYLLGSTTLGVVEAIVIGGTVAAVGSPLAVPVAVFTFLAAYVPMVGAIVAGAVAVLASLVGGGPGAALIVLVVAIAVQQLDNDLLAPFVYGRATQLHPAVVLLSIATGTAIAGLAGAVLAVPIVTVGVAISRAIDEDSVAEEVRSQGDVEHLEATVLG